MARPNQMHHHQSPPMPNFCGNGFGPWNHGAHPERVGFPQGPVGWQGAPQSPSPYIVKKILRLEIPTDTYPNFNFIGRLLGPRGNSLKRIEATTGCRVFIRGKGSIKDPGKEPTTRSEARASWTPSITAWPTTPPLGRGPRDVSIISQLGACITAARRAQFPWILFHLLPSASSNYEFWL